MNLAWLSVGALAVAVMVSCFSRLNVGVLALVLAWIVGVLIGGMKVDAVLSGFPVGLFSTLAGMTMLFSAAEENGTLQRWARFAVAGCRGNTFLVPVMFFAIAAAMASAGPGNISTAALVAPMAMAAAGRAGIPAFLMAIMVGNGANAGSLSPLAPTGIIVSGLMAKIGLGGHEIYTWVAGLFGHAAVGFGGYLLFGGWKLLGRRWDDPEIEATAFERQHWMTTGVIALLVAGLILFQAHAGMAAFTAVAVLTLAGAADIDAAIRRMPWGVMVMVCGVTVLIALLEKTNGLGLFTDLLAKAANAGNVTGVVAFVTGIISAYSSTSGVVLPAFLPTVPGLVARLGGGNPLGVATAMNVGSHLVDVSPLSTIGALCVAGVAPGEARALFHKMLAWGLSMAVVGALGCWLLL